MGIVHFFRIKGGRPECVIVSGCATQGDVAGIKYRICVVCVLERRN